MFYDPFYYWLKESFGGFWPIERRCYRFIFMAFFCCTAIISRKLKNSRIDSLLNHDRRCHARTPNFSPELAPGLNFKTYSNYSSEPLSIASNIISVTWNFVPPYALSIYILLLCSCKFTLLIIIIKRSLILYNILVVFLNQIIAWQSPKRFSPVNAIEPYIKAAVKTLSMYGKRQNPYISGPSSRMSGDFD